MLIDLWSFNLKPGNPFTVITLDETIWRAANYLVLAGAEPNLAHLDPSLLFKVSSGSRLILVTPLGELIALERERVRDATLASELPCVSDTTSGELAGWRDDAGCHASSRTTKSSTQPFFATLLQVFMDNHSDTSSSLDSMRLNGSMVTV